jgi:hypothetical protein
LASGANPFFKVAPRSLFFGEWCKSFFQGCATEPLSVTKLTKIKCFYKLIGILVVY